jgi:4-amino-4-deoxychorismate mutase
VTVTVEPLEELRRTLGEIDESLLAELRRRLECCVEIARVKKAHGVPMMQPQRIGVAHERAARYADEHGLSREFLRRLYDVIIEETCRVEQLVIEGAPNERAG